MAKLTHSQKNDLKQRSAGKQKARSSTIAELAQTKESSKKKHGSAMNTNSTYDGYIRRGKQWLAELVKDFEQEDELEHPRGCPAGLEGMKWNIGDLIQAFDTRPNRASPWALASYIACKCFVENLGESTGDGIHAAFKRYWDRV